MLGTSLCWQDNPDILLATKSYGYILYSADGGVSWTTVTTPNVASQSYSRRAIENFCYNDGWYCGQGLSTSTSNTANKNLLVSEDGQTWAAKTLGTGRGARVNYVFSYNKIVIVSTTGGASSSSTRVTYKSTDGGSSFVQCPDFHPFDRDPCGIAYGNGTLVWAISGTPVLYYSKNNGESWTAVEHFSPSSYTPRHIIFANGVFTILAYDGDDCSFFQSSDGVSWSRSMGLNTSNGAVSPYLIRCAGGYYVVGADRGKLAYTPKSNPSSWTVVDVSGDSRNPAISPLYNGDKYICGQITSSGVDVYSASSVSGPYTKIGTISGMTSADCGIFYSAPYGSIE